MLTPSVRRPGDFVAFPREEVESSIAARFQRVVELYPERVAVKVGDCRRSYRALNVAANRVAHSLLRRGGERPAQVAVLCEHDGAMIEAALGILKAGKVWVPLDASYPQARNAYILEHSQATGLITDERNAESAEQLAAGTCPVMTIGGSPSTVVETNPGLAIPPEAAACLLYTSGSTGQPKGVVHSQRALLHLTMHYTNAQAVAPSDRASLLSSCSHISAMGALFRALLNGATVLPLDPRRLGPGEVANWVQREAISVWHMTPTLFRHVVRAFHGDEAFPELRLIQLGGEPLAASDVALFRRYFPRSCVLLNYFGCTEIPSFRQYAIDHDTELTGPSVPVGHAVEETDVLILDGNGREAPPGQAGEIAVKSRYLALGYWRDPELTRAKFTTVDGKDGCRVYRTGDLGRLLPDGCLLHLGRLDFQVQIRGYRVETGEVEQALMDSGQLDACAVVGAEDPSGDTQLVAYLVPAPSGSSEAGALRALLQSKLPSYMVPAVFVWLEALPRLPNGKLDRRALPAPDWVHPVREHAFVPPRTPIEERVAAVWAQVLGVDAVGRDDHFLELGGTSLLATQVMARLRSALGVQLPQLTLFDEPSLAEFAARVAEARHESLAGVGPAPLVHLAGSDVPAPLSYAQQRMWFFNQLEPSSALYNQLFGPLGISSRPCAGRWTGPLDVGALERSLGEIVRRHEVLRTRYPYSADGVMPEVLPATPFHLPVEDVTGLPDGDREHAASERVLAEYHRPFDLTAEPPLRAVLLRLAPEEHVLVVVIHHIAYDRWSRGILLRELAVLYTAYAAGDVSPLPEPALQYRDYACWQREQLQGEAMARDLAFWRQRLLGAPVRLALPGDRPRPTVHSHTGGCCAIPLAGGLVDRLERLAHSERASLMMVLVAALQAQLAGHTGSTDVSLGIAIAGRTRLELEEMVGCCTNTLVLRTDISGDPTFRDLLGRVRRETLRAYAHQDLPFERLVEELQPTRTPGYHPFFQVLFNYLEVPRWPAEIPGVRIEEFEVGLDTALVDLSVHVERTGTGTVCYLTYSRDLFDHARAASWAEDYAALLQAVAAAPDRPLAIRLPRSGHTDEGEAADLVAELEQMSDEDAERALYAEASPRSASARRAGGPQ